MGNPFFSGMSPYKALFGFDPNRNKRLVTPAEEEDITPLAVPDILGSPDELIHRGTEHAVLTSDILPPDTHAPGGIPYPTGLYYHSKLQTDGIDHEVGYTFYDTTVLSKHCR